MPDTRPLTVRLQDHIESNNLMEGCDTVLLAVSGGTDSVALLGLMSGIAPELGVHLKVAHIDHGIHPESADVAEIVMALCMRLGIPGYLTSLHLGPGTSETVARERRYEALNELMEEVQADCLATAHHADDQVETILMRVLRGTGVAGLAGMRARTGLLVRPLLPFSRNEIAGWLSTRPDLSRSVHHDPANADEKHDRVWLRRVVVPALHDRADGNSIDGVLRVGQHAAADSTAWSQLLRTWPELGFKVDAVGARLNLSALRQLPMELALAVIQAAAREAGLRLGPEKSAQVHEFILSSQSGRAVQLAGAGENGPGGRVALELDTVLFDSEPVRTVTPPVATWGDDQEGEVAFGSCTFYWESCRAGETDRRSRKTFVTPGRGTIRALEPGDRIFPLGGTGYRKVRREFMEQRVPVAQRRVHPIVERSGEILWIPGVCRSRDAVPEPGQPAMKLWIEEARDQRD